MTPAERGFTLIELVISMVIISIGVTGILLVMNRTTASSADPMIQHQAIAIADAYLEEISTKSYSTQPGSGSRDQFDDVDDYKTLPDTVVRDQTGAAIGALAAYSVAVTITDGVTLNGVTAIQIDVTVNNGSTSVSLTGYKTDY